MNKRSLGLIAALLAVSQLSLAAVTPVDLSGVRSVGPVSAKYKIEQGPAAQPPDGLQNLTEEQLQQLAKFLVPDPYNPPKNLPPALLYRLIDAMAKVDMHYQRPIPAPEWDQRIKDMQDEFTKQNGAPGSKPMSSDEWEKAIDGMIGGMVKKLGDPHTVYMGREDAKRFAEQMKGSFVGVGATVEKVATGIKLTTVFPGSGAEKAGLKAGDVVTEVEGKSIVGLEVDQVINKLRGPAGTKVTIKVERLQKPVTITRAAVQMPDLFGKMAAPEVGYVYFSQFGPKIDERLFAEIDKLKAKGAKRLIIDLRGNGGGLLNMAQSIGSEFLKDKDVIVSTKKQGKLAERAVTDGAGRFYGMPVAVLVNGGSASASEVLAAALQEHKVAKVVGSQSYGKGSFQLPMATEIPIVAPGGIVVGTRPDGTLIKVTEGGWYTPMDKSVEGKHDPATGRNVPGSGGVTPDAVVTQSDAEQEAAMKGIFEQLFGRGQGGKDAVLDKAVEVLQPAS